MADINLNTFFSRSIPYILTILITGLAMFFLFKSCRKDPVPVLVQSHERDSVLNAKVDSVNIEIQQINTRLDSLRYDIQRIETMKIINQYYYKIEQEQVNNMSPDSLYNWLKLKGAE